jgi:hypothetical protein
MITIQFLGALQEVKKYGTEFEDFFGNFLVARLLIRTLEGKGSEREAESRKKGKE